MNITVVGTGYVGLVTGTCFAETGNNVTCVDIDADKVARMKAGEVPIYEPGLEILFERNTKQGRLKFTTHLAKAVKKAEIIFSFAYSSRRRRFCRPILYFGGRQGSFRHYRRLQSYCR